MFIKRGRSLYMTLTELRYYFEHEVLSKYFWEDSEPFLSDILQVMNIENENGDENILYDLICEMAQENEVELPYSKDEYQAELFWLDKDDFAIRVRFPKPEETLLCDNIFMIFCMKDFTPIRYFTVELLEKKWRKNVYCLCEWEQNGFHRNHMFVSKNLKKIQDKIIQLYEM